MVGAEMVIGMIATYDLYDNPLVGGIAGDAGGYREKSGNVITFGEDYVRPAEMVWSPSQQAGDREVVSGRVDLAAKTFVYETYTERDGVIITRSVTEGVLLSDSSAIMQWLNAAPPSTGMEPEGKALFFCSDAQNVKVLRGSFPHDTNFDYGSILGRGALSAEDMAAGYTLVWDIVSDLQTASSTKY